MVVDRHVKIIKTLFYKYARHMCRKNCHSFWLGGLKKSFQGDNVDLCLEGWDVCHVGKVGQTISDRESKKCRKKKEREKIASTLKALVLYECQELGLEICTRADQDMTNIDNPYR